MWRVERGSNKAYLLLPHSIVESVDGAGNDTKLGLEAALTSATCAEFRFALMSSGNTGKCQCVHARPPESSHIHRFPTKRFCYCRGRNPFSLVTISGAIRLFEAAVLPHSLPHGRAPPAADRQRSGPVGVLGCHRR